jgi:Tol biopolymer transport system component
MGEVYRATDTKLKRHVAIKILPPALAADHDRLARFQREAEVLASLNHPHIAGIYGLDESEGVSALVMELVEGEDLSQRIARGAIPIDEVLPIAKQIAEALEAAHDRGIIHRDLKPANVKVRSDGTVKVLDFGLAKAMDVGAGGPGGAGGASMSPTLSIHATQAGIILGTAAYMAPEQAKGRPIDKRADIWAFGVVLHEMLTGRRLFEAEDISETLASVLTRDVSLTTLPAAIPARLRALLRDCLIRDPKQRLRDIGDARIVLDRIIAGAPDDAMGITAATAAVAPSWSRALPWAFASALSVVAVAMLILWAPWRAEQPSDRSLVRLDVDLGDDVSLPAPTGAGSSIAISPDGTRLAYVSGAPTRLFVRRLDQPKATALPGTQGATQPVFSRDGQWVGFVSGRKVGKIPVDGGAVVQLGDFTGIRGVSWSEDGSIVIGASKLVRIPSGGGAPETIAEPRNGEIGLIASPELPGGRTMLAAVDNPGPVDKTAIDVITLADRQRRTVVQGGASPRYLATGNGTGHLVYVNGSALFAVPFDLKTLSTLGAAVPVVDDVAHDSLVGTGQFDVSRTGTLVYRRAIGSASAPLTLQWLDASGKREPMGAKPGVYRDMSVSPDGTRMALTVVEGGSQDIWIYEVRRDVMTRLTFGGMVCRLPQWSPDGSHVVFAVVGKGIYQIRADGGTEPQPLTLSKNLQYPSSFSPDGKWLAIEEATQVQVVRIEAQGGWLKAGTPEPFSRNGLNERSASFSLDGRWLAYESEQSGTTEVYVRPFPPRSSDSGGQWLVSNNGGSVPRWSRNGRDLLYQSGDQIMAVRYTASGDAFTAEKPRVWIAGLGGPGALWDPTPDGSRVAAVTPAGGTEPPRQEHEIVMLLNFFDELRRRVPIGKYPMALTRGARLGVYEVTAQLGEGGMGQIYRGGSATPRGHQVERQRSRAAPGAAAFSAKRAPARMFGMP